MRSLIFDFILIFISNYFLLGEYGSCAVYTFLFNILYKVMYNLLDRKSGILVYLIILFILI